MKVSPFILLLLILAGCVRHGEDLSPPQVQFGQTDCSQCGMSVSDVHYAAALIVRTPDGEQEPRVFDDIGCMAAYEREHRELRVLARYVKDFNTGVWLTADRAVYVQSAAIRSPMGYGLLATASPDIAAALARSRDGQLIDFKDVQGSSRAIAVAR